MAKRQHYRSPDMRRMRPRARLISLIGDELISDESVAVVELVKNAYDADATHVSVSFAGSGPKRSRHVDHHRRWSRNDPGNGYVWLV